MTTPTPSFPVETKKDKKGVVFEAFDSNVDKYVEKLVKPIFDKVVPKETDLNRVSVGFVGFSDKVFCLYQPHNYRLYFDFQKLGFKIPKTEVNSSVVFTYKLKNSSEHFFKGYGDFSMTVKKHTIEIINLVESKRWYRIELKKDISEFHTQIKDIVSKKDDECRAILKQFIKEFGGTSAFRIMNRRSEDKVMLEDSVDKIPIKMAFHSDVVKKVYNERNVEFNNPAYVVNYLENRAIEKISPDIANELLSIRNSIRPLQFLKANIKCSEDYFLFKERVLLLSDFEKDELQNWWFTKFKS